MQVTRVSSRRAPTDRGGHDTVMHLGKGGWGVTAAQHPGLWPASRGEGLGRTEGHGRSGVCPGRSQQPGSFQSAASDGAAPEGQGRRGRRQRRTRRRTGSAATGEDTAPGQPGAQREWQRRGGAASGPAAPRAR